VIADPLLRWVVTAVFVFSAAEAVFAIATGGRVWRHVVAHGLHLAMAVAMAIMAWPSGAALPTTPPMVFFGVATLWFVGVMLAQSSHRLVNGYHAVMMLAMAWMYAVMSGGLSPQQPPGMDTAAAADGGHGGHGSMPGMPGMAMPGGDASDSGSSLPPFVDGIDWLFTAGFTLAAIWWLYRYFVERKADPDQPAHRFLGAMSQVLMAAGMAAMFAVML
jgi:hypothetical protein